MKSLVTLFALISLTTLAFAQPPLPVAKGKITGVVLDSTNTKAVEFANVALLDPATKSPINGSVCDDQGKFLISDVPHGKYIVSISFLGYRTKAIPVQVTGSELDLGSVQLSPAATVLKGVEVTAQKNLIEEKVDRMVYNAENDATAKGGDATDVLRRVPLLTVDLDGNVSLRGSSNLKVLINNKPSTITATSVADALKQIPADQIKTVEVITSPSAKYDAEGSAGIINIITKKNTLEGLTMNINSSAGFRGSNLGLQGGYRKGKLGLSLAGFGRANYNTNGDFINNQDTYTRDGNNNIIGTNSTIQSASTRNQNIFGNYSFGADYDIDKNNSLNGSVRFGIRDGQNFQDGLTTQSFVNGTPDITGSSLKGIDQLNNSHSVDASLNYTHLFAKQNREFSLLTLYSQSNGENNFTTTTFQDKGVNTLTYLKNINPTVNTEATIQADYQTPVNDNQMLEIGGKNISRHATSNADYLEAASDGVYSPSTNPAYKSNALDYTQNVTAGYLSYTLSTSSKYSIKGGVRYEYTTVDAQTSSGPFTTSYGVVVPSFNVSKRLSDGSFLKFAYNRRIQRPSIQNLNPNVVVLNPKSVSSGDPTLSPEYTNNYELSINKFIKNTTLNFSTFIRTTDNSITQIRYPDPDFNGAIHTVYKNIGVQDAYGASLFANVSISNKFTLSGGSDVYYAYLKNPGISDTDPLKTTNSGWVFNLRGFGNYTIGKGWGLQFFGFFRGQQVTLQGYQGNFRIYSLALQKEFNEKRGSIGFGAENFATPSIVIKSSSVSPLVNQQTANTINYINFKVTFSYRIGKLSMGGGPRRGSKSINNDDLKDSGGDDGGGQGGQPMGGGQQGGGQRGGAMGGQGGQKPQPNLKMAAADPTKEVNAAGSWNYTIESPQGGGGKINIKKEGTTYSGTIISSRNNREVALKSVTVVGNEITIDYEVSFNGNTMTFNIKGTIKEDDLNGNMTVGQFGTFPINAKREKQ